MKLFEVWIGQWFRSGCEWVGDEYWLNKIVVAEYKESAKRKVQPII